VSCWRLSHGAARPQSRVLADGDERERRSLRLEIGLVWWIIGMILAAGYFAFLYRSFAGKVVVDANRHGSGK